jgi:hypothetical protein
MISQRRTRPFASTQLFAPHVSCRLSLALLLAGCAPVATKPPATSTAWTSIATVASGTETPGSDLDLDTVTDDPRARTS